MESIKQSCGLNNNASRATTTTTESLLGMNAPVSQQNIREDVMHVYANLTQQSINEQKNMSEYLLSSLDSEIPEIKTKTQALIFALVIIKTSIVFINYNHHLSTEALECCNNALYLLICNFASTNDFNKYTAINYLSFAQRIRTDDNALPIDFNQYPFAPRIWSTTLHLLPITICNLCYRALNNKKDMSNAFNNTYIHAAIMSIKCIQNNEFMLKAFLNDQQMQTIIDIYK